MSFLRFLLYTTFFMVVKANSADFGTVLTLNKLLDITYDAVKTTQKNERDGMNISVHNSTFKNLKKADTAEVSPRFQHRSFGNLPSFGGFNRSNLNHHRVLGR